MKKVRIFFFFTALYVLASTSYLVAEDLTIQFSGHTVDRDTLHAYFSLKGAISYDTIDAIRNGITAKFFITFQLSRSGGLLGIGRSTYIEKVETFNISYDVWENLFIIEDRNRKGRHQALSSSDIINKINSIISPLSLSLTSTRNAEPLYLRAKVKMQTIKLFPPFGIFLIFFDPWNYESRWVYTDIEQ